MHCSERKRDDSAMAVRGTIYKYTNIHIGYVQQRGLASSRRPRDLRPLPSQWPPLLLSLSLALSVGLHVANRRSIPNNPFAMRGGGLESVGA